MCKLSHVVYTTPLKSFRFVNYCTVTYVKKCDRLFTVCSFSSPWQKWTNTVLPQCVIVTSTTGHSYVNDTSQSCLRRPENEQHFRTVMWIIKYIQKFDTFCSWANLECWHDYKVWYGNLLNVQHPFMYLFLIYTPVMYIKIAFFQQGLNKIVTHKNVRNS